MRLKSNGGTMVVTKKAEMAGYHTDVWFDRNAITNILALSNVIKQYCITYDSDEQMFLVVHRESANKPNMEFLLHESGLHYYDPRNTKTVCNDANLGCDKNFIERLFGGGGVQYEFKTPLLKRPYRMQLGLDIDRQRDYRQRFNNINGVKGARVLEQNENHDESQSRPLPVYGSATVEGGGRRLFGGVSRHTRVHVRRRDDCGGDREQPRGAERLHGGV